MRTINYDSATVNIFVFTEQRNISFQNDISLKTMGLHMGVVWWEKFKNRETHSRIASWRLDQLGRRRAILLMFSSCWSPGRVKTLQKFILSSSKLAIVLIWNIQSSHKDNISSCERYKSSGHNARSALLDSGTGTIDLRQLSIWYRALSCGAD